MVLKLAEQFDIKTKEELAMFLAQVIWESAGLQVKKHKVLSSKSN